MESLGKTEKDRKKMKLRKLMLDKQRNRQKRRERKVMKREKKRFVID
jgi:hypothetical protein